MCFLLYFFIDFHILPAYILILLVFSIVSSAFVNILQRMVSILEFDQILLAESRPTDSARKIIEHLQLRQMQFVGEGILEFGAEELTQSQAIDGRALHLYTCTIAKSNVIMTKK